MSTTQSHYLFLPIWRDRPATTPHERRCRTIEALISMWCDLGCDDDIPLMVVRDLIRPDLAIADIRMAYMEICDLSSERAEHENDGPVEEWEALTGDYEAALGDLATRPGDALTAIADSVFGRPIRDVQLPENVHDIGSRR